MSDVLTYQDLLPLQDVLLRQLGGGASSVHRVAGQIGIRWPPTSTEIISPIIADLEVSAWLGGSRLIVTLLVKGKEKGE